MQIVDDDGDGLSDWIARHFPLKPLDSSVLFADPDADGALSLIEWMTDSNPTLSGDAKTPRVDLYHGPQDDHLGIRFYANPAKDTHRTVIEGAPTLTNASWTTLWDSEQDPARESELIIEAPESGAGWMTIRSPNPLGATEFMRVRYAPNP